METVPIPNAKALSRRERRRLRRDRRLLDGTMKYRGEFMPVDIVNLSADGAYLVAPLVPQMSDSVTITVDLPAADGAVMIAGRVRGITLSSRVLDRPAGFGIEFTRFFSRAGEQTLREHLDG